jgi:hypothetical protein
MSKKEDGGLRVMLFEFQGFPPSGNTEVSDIPSERISDLFEPVSVGIRLDDGKDVRLTGAFLQGLEIFKKTVRAQLDP